MTLVWHVSLGGHIVYCILLVSQSVCLSVCHVYLLVTRERKLQKVPNTARVTRRSGLRSRSQGRVMLRHKMSHFRLCRSRQGAYVSYPRALRFPSWIMVPLLFKPDYAPVKRKQRNAPLIFTLGNNTQKYTISPIQSPQLTAIQASTHPELCCSCSCCVCRTKLAFS